MRKAVLFLTAVTVVAVFCVGVDAERGRGRVAYRTIDVPGATATTPTDVNNRGDIAGFYSADAEQLPDYFRRAASSPEYRRR